MNGPPQEVAGIRATWLGHSTLALELEHVRLLTDPVLRRRVGPLVRSDAAPAPESWSDPDVVLLSHLHHDHADLASLRRLGGAPVASGPDNQHWLAAHDLRVAGLVEGAWWPVPPRVGGARVEVRLVKAVHHSRRMPHRPNGAHGFLVRSPGAALWFAGDTDLYDEMAELPAVAGRPIDLALLPIGGWGPRLSAGHLGPDSAAEAARASGARAVLPIHFGTLRPVGWPRRRRGWMNQPLHAFSRALEQRAPGVVLLAPPP